MVKATEIQGFSTQILQISLSGKNVDVVVKEIQRHPSSSRVIHADFMRVDADSKITLTVPIRTVNEDNCIGIKVSGGQVNHLINDIEISCLASNLPEALEIDVQEMDIGSSVLLSEINLPEGVEITALIQGEERDQAVISVTETKEMFIEEEIEEEAIEGEEVEDGEIIEGEETPAEENISDKDPNDGENSQNKEKK